MWIVPAEWAAGHFAPMPGLVVPLHAASGLEGKPAPGGKRLPGTQ